MLLKDFMQLFNVHLDNVINYTIEDNETGEIYFYGNSYIAFDLFNNKYYVSSIELSAKGLIIWVREIVFNKPKPARRKS